MDARARRSISCSLWSELWTSGASWPEGDACVPKTGSTSFGATVRGEAWLAKTRSGSGSPASACGRWSLDTEEGVAVRAGGAVRARGLEERERTLDRARARLIADDSVAAV